MNFFYRGLYKKHEEFICIILQWLPGEYGQCKNANTQITWHYTNGIEIVQNKCCMMIKKKSQLWLLWNVLCNWTGFLFACNLIKIIMIWYLWGSVPNKILS